MSIDLLILLQKHNTERIKIYVFHQFRVDITKQQSDRTLPVQEINTDAAEFVARNNLFYWTRRQTDLVKEKNGQALKHFT